MPLSISFADEAASRATGWAMPRVMLLIVAAHMFGFACAGNVKDVPGGDARAPDVAVSVDAAPPFQVQSCAKDEDCGNRSKCSALKTCISSSICKEDADCRVPGQVCDRAGDFVYGVGGCKAPPPQPVCNGDKLEPNGQLSQAMPLIAGQAVTAALCSGDVDIFKFELNAPADVSVAATWQGDASATLAIHGMTIYPQRLYGVESTIAGSASCPKDLMTPLCPANALTADARHLPPGTYFVLLGGDTVVGTAGYSLTLTVTSAACESDTQCYRATVGSFGGMRGTCEAGACTDRLFTARQPLGGMCDDISDCNPSKWVDGVLGICSENLKAPATTTGLCTITCEQDRDCASLLPGWVCKERGTRVCVPG